VTGSLETRRTRPTDAEGATALVLFTPLFLQCLPDQLDAPIGVPKVPNYFDVSSNGLSILRKIQGRMGKGMLPHTAAIWFSVRSKENGEGPSPANGVASSILTGPHGTLSRLQPSKLRLNFGIRNNKMQDNYSGCQP
jgi:hypothetical protein